MNDLTINSNQIQPVTSIPTVFFDIYMCDANGEFLKVYLYIYRWSTDTSHGISIGDIADRMFMTERDVLRALKYWQSKGLLLLTFDDCENLTGITLLPLKPNEDSASKADALSADIKNKVQTSPESPCETSGSTQNLIRETASVFHQTQADYTKPQYTMKEISEFSQKNDGQQLFFVLQQYVGHPLSQTEINSIVFFHEKLGFSTDLIEYLFEYCVGNNHRSIHYIEKVAISWAEAGIDTVAKAKGRSALYSKTHYAVLKAFGITGRNPAKKETDYINKWTDEYCFSPTLIVEACNRAIAVTHAPSFDYADRILQNWKEKKVVNLNDVKALDASYEKNKKAADAKKAAGQKSGAAERRGSKASSPVNRFNNFSQRTYNYDELEQKLARKIQTSAENK